MDKTLSKYEFTILGSIPSKSNQYNIITKKGADGKWHGSLKKSDAMDAYEKRFYLQCPYRGLNLKGYFILTVKVFNESNRKDIDNSFKGILDCLQSCQVIKNDRQCTEIHAYKFVDKNNPRVEITITEIEL
jgi:Holliday junction resolvase RusA-like endonuclease